MVAKTGETGSVRLAEILAGAGVPLVAGSQEIWIGGLSTDSRQVGAGDLFIGVPGEHVDGGRFWRQAVAAGAVGAVISEEAAQQTQVVAGQDPVWVVAEDRLPQICAQMAAAFYGCPGQDLTLVGVTGTNGKTTTTHLIEHLLSCAGRSTALIGTLYSRWPGQMQIASHTTPFAVDLQRTLAQIRDAGCGWGVMEVSSHALAQQRVWGCRFAAAVWTNLTQDHLDFHPTMEDYWQAKATLFSPEYLTGRAIINQEDPGGARLLQRLRDSGLDPWSYGMSAGGDRSGDQAVDLWPEAVELGADRIRARIRTPVGAIEAGVPMAGAFNLANLLGAIGAGVQLGIELGVIEAALPEFPGVPGRMEMVQLTGSEQDITVIVDYAHTPDGLENLLRAVRPTVVGRLICVFGCGGDRDRTKRPLMGRIAADWSDRVIVTSDNPRTEDPEQILVDILAGFDREAVPTEVQGDRRQAILGALLGARSGDTVVIAGKGHEDYQILGTTKVHFDDREVARQGLQERLG